MEEDSRLVVYLVDSVVRELAGEMKDVEASVAVVYDSVVQMVDELTTLIDGGNALDEVEIQVGLSGKELAEEVEEVGELLGLTVLDHVDQVDWLTGFVELDDADEAEVADSG